MAPYIFLSLLLLTAILLAQQAARLAEACIYADLPFSLLGSLPLPSFPAFSFLDPPRDTRWNHYRLLAHGKRQRNRSDACRGRRFMDHDLAGTAGRIGLTGATTYLHLKEAPEAARDLERIALQGALAKLDSPVEPRTFSTLPRYVIYVRDGNRELGTWGRVFIFAQRSDGTTESIHCSIRTDRLVRRTIRISLN